MYRYIEVLRLVEEQRKLERRLKWLMQKTKIVERYARRDSAEFNGIPEQPNEILTSIVIRVSSFIGCTIREEDIFFAKRIGSRSPRPIIVKFTNRYVRDRLVLTSINYDLEHLNDNLNTRQLGFTGKELPVLISSHPSSLNKFHRKRARAAELRNQRRIISIGIQPPLRAHRPIYQRVKSLRTLAIIAINKHNLRL
ncbi:unnamed protein product [Arctia plantaginis]|uniref:Uncharacterized protein n=1 Tax=Arctia plantaginis TaxID=874455 RepID=A0A8S0Z430_ARCPL|nr:unnamed protein product [Arctia plantaginis]